jgi:glycosyltransferase involved in cell wall biosynthesis
MDELTVGLSRTEIERRDQRLLSGPAALPQISIVVPTYSLKRIHSLLGLLASIQAQDVERIETIVVADADPHDALADLRRKVDGKRFRNVSIIANTGRGGASAARNTGIAAAQGEIIAFVDDDAELTPGWAQVLMQTYRENPGIVGVVGSVEPLWESRDDSWLPKELYWIIGCTGWLRESKGGVAAGPGTGISFRKDALGKAGVFSLALGQRGASDKWREWNALAEDSELCMRVQVRTKRPLLFNPNVRVRHLVPRYKLTSRWIASRSYQVGRSRAMLRRLYRGHAPHLQDLELGLLKQLLFSNAPEILGLLFRHRLQAWLRLRAVMLALEFASFGYLTYSFWSIIGWIKAPVESTLLEAGSSRAP